MSIKHDSSSKLFESFIKSINKDSPINISWLTLPLMSTINERIKLLENFYGRSRLYSWLIKKGVYPIVLFSLTTGGIGYSAHRTYTQSSRLVIHLVGVVYPIYQGWQLLHQSNTQHQELKSWLTYWLIFGSFQVLDHLISLPSFKSYKEKYKFYQLLILYWAQNPQSNGAQLLYKYVLQKPISEEEREEGGYQQEKNEIYDDKTESIKGYSLLDESIELDSSSHSYPYHDELETEQSLQIIISPKEEYSGLMNSTASEW